MTTLEKLEKSGFNKYTRTKRRTLGSEYANILVASCPHEDWWYKDLIGMEFFCRLSFSYFNGTKVLYDATPIRLSRTQEEYCLYSFHPKDVIV